MLIDTHAHLASEAFEDDYQTVLGTALNQDIGVIIVGSDMGSSRRAVRIAEEYNSGVYAAVGLHPRYIDDPDGSVKDFIDEDAYRNLAVNPKVVAIGESGLDYTDLPDSMGSDPKLHKALKLKRLQKKAFNFFLQLSYATRMPLILHCREAHEDMLETLHYFDKKESVGFDSHGVVHGFEGDWDQASKYMNLDFFLSFTGKLVDAHNMRDIVKKTPEAGSIDTSSLWGASPPHPRPDFFSKRNPEKKSRRPGYALPGQTQSTARLVCGTRCAIACSDSPRPACGTTSLVPGWLRQSH